MVGQLVKIFKKSSLELLQNLNLKMLALSQVHAGIAEVAAAKARMFINKPDGSTLFEFLKYFLDKKY